MKVTGLEVLRCDAGWRNYYFLKLSTEGGIVGWSEFDEGFGSPGITAVIERLASRVIGHSRAFHACSSIAIATAIARSSG